MILAWQHRGLIARVALLVGLIYGGWWARGYVEGVADLRAANASLEAALADARQTANVLRGHYARQDREARAHTALIDQLKSMEGQDAPLSDLLAAAAAGLWP